MRFAFALLASCACCITSAAVADGGASPEQSEPAQSATRPKNSTKGGDGKNRKGASHDHRVRLKFQAAPWSQVLNRLAKHSGLTLVMKRCPPGTFTRNDPSVHTVPEATRILNQELESAGFRIIRQGPFLLVLDLDDLRSTYKPSASTLRDPRDEEEANSSPGSDGPSTTGKTESGIRTVSGSDEDRAPKEPRLLNPDGEEKSTSDAEKGRQRRSPSETGKSVSDRQNDDEKISIEDRQIRLLFISTPWTGVLPSVAKQAGLSLVMKRCPAGSYHHPQWTKYPLSEAIEILNHELESSGFRLVIEDDFLVVLNLEDLRADYERPVVHRRSRTKEEPKTPVNSDVRTAAVPKSRSAIQPASAEIAGSDVVEPALFDSQTVDRRAAGPTISEPTTLQPVAAESPVPMHPPAEAASEAKSPTRHEAAEDVFSTVDSPAAYSPRHERAEVIAKRMYKDLKSRSGLTDAGPEGLPSFRVFDAEEPGPARGGSPPTAGGAHSRVRFTVGVDVDRNRLVVDAAPKRRAAVMRIFEQLDQPEGAANRDLQLVAANASTCTLAQNAIPELNRLVDQRKASEPFAQAPTTRAGDGESRGSDQNGPANGEKSLSEIVKGLKGDVTVESVPELGILILRGGKEDVEAMMKVIREIERLSAVSAPKIQVLALKHVSSASFATLLNEVYKELQGLRTSEKEAKQTVKVFPIVNPNAVLIIASQADLPGVLKLASELDMPVQPDVEFQVFHLQNAFASQVAKAVTDSFKTPVGLGTKVVAIPDLRTNSVIVQGGPSDLARIKQLILQLDGPTASTATIKVFTLRNGDATTIQRLLETLFQTTNQRSGGANANAENDVGNEPGVAPLRFSADVRTNSIIAIGPPDKLQAALAVITRLDNGDAHQRTTEIIRLKNNSADAVQQAINGFITSQRELQQIDPELMSSVELLEREVFVVSEPYSNSLLLSATPRYFTELKKMVDQLDRPPAQVIIQVLIVEVELDNTDQFGIELGLQSPVLFDRSQLGGQVFQSTTITPIGQPQVTTNKVLSESATPGFQFNNPTSVAGLLGSNPAVSTAQVGTQELTNLGVGTINPALNFSGLVLSASSESVSALLRALSYKQTIHVLSRPQIRTLDNRMATIQVGQQVPIINGVSTTTTGALQPLVQYNGAGIILTVLPRITPEGMISLEAYAENSVYLPGGVTLLSNATTGTSIQSPVKNIERVEASLNVASGNTVVMGGMISSNDTVISQKVPWFSDLPIVGQAFRFDSKQTVRKELLIFLTPRMIRDSTDDEMIKQIESERMHYLMDEAESIHGPILSVTPPVEPAPPQRMVPDWAPPAAKPPRPENAPAVIPDSSLLDDPNVPTTTMPPAPDHDVKPFPAPPAADNSTSRRAISGQKAGAVRFASFEEPANDPQPVRSTNTPSRSNDWLTAEPSSR